MAGRDLSVVLRRTTVIALVATAFLVAAPLPPAGAVEIEGVQPAALDQPRVNVSLRREPRGRALQAAATPLGGEATINVQAFLDTGASGILLSKMTSEALGIARSKSRNKEVEFHDVGVGGTERFAVSEPLYVSLAPFGGNVGADGNVNDYPLSFGPVRVQINTAGGGLIEMMTGGGLDVVGMPAMKGRVVVLDPTGVDTFGNTMRSRVLDAKKDRKFVPRADRHVTLSYASFDRFTRTEPAGAQGPTLAANPFVGPSPVDKGRSAGKTPPAGGVFGAGTVPPIVVTLNGKQSSGSWLLDTGAAASMISTAQAEAVGVTYRDGTQFTDAPKLDGAPEKEQFTFTIGGVGGQRKCAGFFLDTLTLPTRESDPIVYKRAPVLVADITVEDPKSGQEITLDGVLGMNFFVASANITQAGLMPDINNLTVGAYRMLVFDEPAGTLGLKLKPEFLKAAGRGGTIAKPPARRGR
jgi:hypothetical protein